MLETLQIAIRANDDRQRKFPDVYLFAFADKELQKINTAVADHGRLTTEEYQSLDIGLMCARELESSDMEYCDIIYKMLDEVRPR